MLSESPFFAYTELLSFWESCMVRFFFCFETYEYIVMAAKPDHIFVSMEMALEY